MEKSDKPPPYTILQGRRGNMLMGVHRDIISEYNKQRIAYDLICRKIQDLIDKEVVKVVEKGLEDK